MVSAFWYAVCIVPSIIGASFALDQCDTIRGQIKGMPRMVIPGRATFDLQPGEINIFGESESFIDGDLYENEDFTFRAPCTMADASGRTITLRSRSSKKYSDPYRGKSMYRVDIPARGRYTLECQGDGTGRAVVALGNAQSTLSVLWFLVLLVGGCGSGALFALWVYNQRDT